jgi:hypothetical protein
MKTSAFRSLLAGLCIAPVPGQQQSFFRLHHD